MPPVLGLFDPVSEFKAIHVGHLDVGHDDIELVLAAAKERV